MAQLAKLCFQERSGTKIISGITQLSKEGTHILLEGANDWNGRNATDRVYLLAPYDCVVKAIATYDNTVFFESTGAVATPSGTYDNCWFMCTHMLDADKASLGIAVGKKFLQGQPCYAEGTKGIGTGNHIHMEQGYGQFGGGSAPYKASSDTFKYNGTTYTQYYPVLAAGGKECALKDMMFLEPAEIIIRSSTDKSVSDYYGMKIAPADKSACDNQVYIDVNALRVRSEATTAGRLQGYCAPQSYYTVLEKIEKANSKNKDYDWYKIGPYHWIAGVSGVKYMAATEDKHLKKIMLDQSYDYRWSVDGNKFGNKYDVTVMAGFGDTALKNDGWEEILAVNGGLFYTYDNAHYACGLEKSRGVNNQDVGMTAVSDYNNAMAIGCTYDGQLVFAKQSYIISHLDEYYGAITGIGVLYAGKATTMGQTEFKSQYNTISGRTIIGEDDNGNFLSYSVAGTTGSSGLYGKNMAALCQSLGFRNAICLDGGGSVWRRVNGKADISTTRKVKNALILYRKKKAEPDPEPIIIDPTDDLAKQVEDLTKALNQVKADLENAQKDIDEKAKKIAEVEKNYESTKNELAQSQKTATELKNQLTEVNSQVTKLNNKISQIKVIVG